METMKMDEYTHRVPNLKGLGSHFKVRFQESDKVEHVWVKQLTRKYVKLGNLTFFHKYSVDDIVEIDPETKAFIRPVSRGSYKGQLTYTRVENNNVDIRVYLLEHKIYCEELPDGLIWIAIPAYYTEEQIKEIMNNMPHVESYEFETPFNLNII